MEYEWNSKIEVQQRNNQYLFVNPEHGSWLKIKENTKDLLEDLLSGKTRDDVPDHTRQAVLHKFIQSGMILSEEQPLLDSEQDYIKSIYLVVTKTCNLTCNFCSMGSSPQRFEQLSTEELKTTIDKLVGRKIGRIVITGGEPFMRKDLQEIIDYTHLKLDCKIIVCSNGLLLTPEKIMNLKGKVSRIDMSVENIFASDKKYGYEKMATIARHLRTNGIDLCLSYVITKENWVNVFRFLDFVNEADVGFSLKIVGPVGRARDHKSLFAADITLAEIYMDIFRYIHSKGYSGRAFQNFLFQKLKPSYGCSAKNKMLSIHVDGGVYSCHSLIFPEFSVGNIREDEMKSILEKSLHQSQTPLYQESFDVDQRQHCSECEVRYFCNGGCFSEMYDNEERMNTLPPECEIKKTLILFNLWSYDQRVSFLDNLSSFIGFFESRMIETKAYI